LVRAHSVSCRLLVVAAFLLPLAQATAAPVVIDGVPQTGWHAGRSTQTIDCLHAGLAAMGCPISYDELMVASGAAFRTAWWPDYYSYMAPEVAPDDLVVVGAEAAGGAAERVDHTTLEDAWNTVCKSIDDGSPVLARRGQGYRVICGYDAAGRRMYYRDYNVATAEYAVGPFEAPEAPWPLKGGHEVIVLLYDRNQKPPELDWGAIVERAVRFADWPPNEKLYQTFVFGLGAYGAWAQTLRKGPDRNGPETDAQAVEFMAMNMAEARACASVVLQEHADIAPSLADAATAYMEEATLFKQFLTVLHGTAAPPGAGAVLATMAAHIGDRRACEQLAKLVEQARDLDA
jgi:hypothetical protein